MSAGIPSNLYEPCPHCRAPNWIFAFDCGDKLRPGFTPTANQPCRKPLIKIGWIAPLVFVVSALGALVLMRTGSSDLPLYILLAAGIIHLYAVTFSRGNALRSAAFWFGGVTACWAAWELDDWLPHQHATRSLGVTSFLVRLRADAEPHIPTIALGLWIAGTIWAFALGRRTLLPGIRIGSSYFLAIGAFVFGLWGYWALMLRGHALTPAIFRIAVQAALIGPFVLLLLLTRTQPRHRVPGAWATLPVLWLAVVATYLGAVELAVRFIEWGLGIYVPHFFGYPALPSVEIGWFARLFDWNAFAAGIAAACCLVLVTASSIASAARTAIAVRPPWYLAAIARLQAAMQAAPAGIAGLGTRISVNLSRLGVRLALVAYKAGDFVWLFLKYCVNDIVRMLREIGRYALRLIRYVLLPFASFTLIALTAFVALARLRGYLDAGAVGAVRVIWAEALLLIVLVIGLCGASFGFASVGNVRYFWDATETTLTGSLFTYAVLTVTSLVFVLIDYILQLRDWSFRGTHPGPLFWFNLVSAAIFLSIVIVLGTIFGRHGTSVSVLSILVPLALVVLLGLWWGFGPLEREFGDAYRSDLTARAAPSGQSSAPLAPRPTSTATSKTTVADGVLRLSSADGAAGGSLTLTGSGFSPGPVTIAWDDASTVLATATADRTGAIRVSVTVPKNARTGRHTIIAIQGRQQTARATFRVSD